MTMTSAVKPLTESVLLRLTSEALLSFLGQAERLEFVMHPGCALALSHEPVADLNYIVAGRGAAEESRFARLSEICIARNLPFLAMVFPSAGAEVDETAEGLGMVHVVDFPIMVLASGEATASGSDSILVRRAAGEADASAAAKVMSGAFLMPFDATLRSMPATLTEVPNLDLFLAEQEGMVAGAVTLTRHGDTAGIWAMGTLPECQRAGIGRRLLSTAIAELSAEGIRRFFLGATPAGQRLYESLGFQTMFSAKIWARGETGQA